MASLPLPYQGDLLAVQSLPPLPAPSSSPVNHAIAIVFALLALVACACVAIHLLRRCLSRRRQRQRSPPATGSRPMPHRASPSSTTTAASDAALSATTAAASDADAAAPSSSAELHDQMARLISSLPLLTVTLAALAKGSADPDCAICLSALEPGTDLRLLPTCRHAFHAGCIDAWLRTIPSCPLCRAGVSLPASAGASANSGSFRRVDIGRISSSRLSSSAAGRRAFSLGGSFDYSVDDVEAVVAHVAPRAGPQGPGDALAEAAGWRGWLRECVDRFSGRWSARWSRDESRRWDPEAAAAMPEDDGAGFMRWIFGS